MPRSVPLRLLWHSVLLRARGRLKGRDGVALSTNRHHSISLPVLHAAQSSTLDRRQLRHWVSHLRRVDGVQRRCREE
jgi:hypothetical protein